MVTSFENVDVAIMGMKLGWNIKMNDLDEIHLDEKSRWNMRMKNIIYIYNRFMAHGSRL